MVKKLTGPELVEIIKVCKESMVYKIELDSVKIEFAGQFQAQWPSYDYSSADPQVDSQRNESIEQAKNANDELSQALLLVNDPEAFEKQLAESN